MIFLSHNKQDKIIVRQIAETFEKVFGREKVFYDEWSIQPGDSITGKMNKEVKHIITDDLSDHLTNRQIKRNSSRVQDLLNFEFEYLDIDIQEKIVGIISALDKNIALNTSINNNLALTKIIKADFRKQRLEVA